MNAVSSLPGHAVSVGPLLGWLSRQQNPSPLKLSTDRPTKLFAFRWAVWLGCNVAWWPCYYPREQVAGVRAYVPEARPAMPHVQ